MGLITTSALNDFIILVFMLLGLVYYAFQRRYSYWKNKGVFYLKPSIPFGNAKNIILGTRQFGMALQDMYETQKHRRFFGIFIMHKPTLIVNDLDLVKHVLTKDFVHFSDHGFTYNEEVEPLSAHLFNMGGEKWKNLRRKLTPTFTAIKMKNAFEVLSNCAGEMGEYLDGQVAKNEIVELKEILAKLATDIIAMYAFGVECKSFKNPNELFRTMGKRIFKPPAFEEFLRTFDFFVPNSVTWIKLKLIGRITEKFFTDLVEKTVKHREENGIVRNDFMQLLIQLKNDGTVDKSDDTPDDGTRLTTIQLAAQAYVFFLAGFETSSTTSSFTLYELAKRHDVQETLAREIDEVLGKHNGKITYESLGEMKYLTQCVEETMRKYPPLPLLFRICTKDYIIPGTNIKIEKDTSVMVPVHGIQRDPDIYPNPDTYDPERFSPENKAARHQYSFLPFGEGPRICIGSRFGMMQVKLALVTVLSKYKVDLCEKTLNPMEYDNRSFLLNVEEGIYLKLKKRI